MSIDKKDVKQGIDQAATHLKQAVDKVVEDQRDDRGESQRSGPAKPAIK